MCALTRDLVFDQLGTLGITSVRVAFFGGHDEGDVEGIRYLDADEHDLDVEIDDGSELFDALCQPIYDRYGGFVGDPQVEGQLVWSVVNRDLTLVGSEQSWTQFEEVL